jgi:hypothetical protein
MKRRIDWAELRVEYVADSMTYAALGKKHGIHPDVIARRAAAERWRGDKLVWQELVAKNAAEAAAIDTVAALAKMNEADLSFYWRGVQLIDDRLSNLVLGLGNEEDIYGLVRARTLLQRMGRISLGVSPDNQLPPQSPDPLRNVNIEVLSDEELSQFQALLTKMGIPKGTPVQ